MLLETYFKIMIIIKKVRIALKISWNIIYGGTNKYLFGSIHISINNYKKL